MWWRCGGRLGVGGRCKERVVEVYVVYAVYAVARCFYMVGHQCKKAHAHGGVN